MGWLARNLAAHAVRERCAYARGFSNDIFGRKDNFRKTQLLLPIFRNFWKFPQVKMGLPSKIEVTISCRETSKSLQLHSIDDINYCMMMYKSFLSLTARSCYFDFGSKTIFYLRKFLEILGIFKNRKKKLCFPEVVPPSENIV